MTDHGIPYKCQKILMCGTSIVFFWCTVKKEVKTKRKQKSSVKSFFIRTNPYKNKKVDRQKKLRTLLG